MLRCRWSWRSLCFIAATAESSGGGQLFELGTSSKLCLNCALGLQLECVALVIGHEAGADDNDAGGEIVAVRNAVTSPVTALCFGAIDC